jgi:GH25 family lysozyme M1 (1,4-beta-N-acetylmuramidase)
MSMTRRQFLGTAAGTAAAVGVGTHARADGPAHNYQVQGLDVAEWQQTVNWGQVAGGGYKFCFHKATEGVPTGDFSNGRKPLDPKFTTNWPLIKANGIIRGAYHMVRAHPSMGTPKAQADYFIDTLLAQSPTRSLSGDLRPALDVEIFDGRTPAEYWQYLQLMVSQIKRRIGRAPIIYSNFYNWRDDVGNPLSNLDCPLWLALWQDPARPETYNTNGFIPRAWSTWTFWQWESATQTDTAPPVPGIDPSLAVDRNTYNGTLEGMNRFRMP